MGRWVAVCSSSVAVQRCGPELPGFGVHIKRLQCTHFRFRPLFPSRRISCLSRRRRMAHNYARSQCTKSSNKGAPLPCFGERKFQVAVRQISNTSLYLSSSSAPNRDDGPTWIMTMQLCMHCIFLTCCFCWSLTLLTVTATRSRCGTAIR